MYNRKLASQFTSNNLIFRSNGHQSLILQKVGSSFNYGYHTTKIDL
jgi:hypothetical protein